jgi:hypothetical protein
VTLTGVAHQPEGARRAQLHVRQLHLPPHAPDDEAFLAPVKLERFAPRETQRHIGRTRRDCSLLRTPGPNELRHTPVAPRKPLLLQLRVEFPRRAALAARPAGVSRQRLSKNRFVRADLLGGRRPPVLHLAANRRPQPRLDYVSRQAGPARNLAHRQAVPQPHPATFAYIAMVCTSSSLQGLTPCSDSRNTLVNFQRAERRFPGQFSTSGNTVGAIKRNKARIAWTMATRFA